MAAMPDAERRGQAVEPRLVHLGAGEVEREGDVLTGGEGGQQVERLEHEADAVTAELGELAVVELGELLVADPGLAAHDGVVVVSWLTFLGKSIAADLGGRDALRHACPPGASLLPLDAGGCILRASAAPATGDVNFGDRLPAYRAVGKLVAPRRASDEALEDFVIEGLEEDQARDWKRRFFE